MGAHFLFDMHIHISKHLLNRRSPDSAESCCNVPFLMRKQQRGQLHPLEARAQKSAALGSV